MSGYEFEGDQDIDNNIINILDEENNIQYISDNPMNPFMDPLDKQPIHLRSYRDEQAAQYDNSTIHRRDFPSTELIDIYGINKVNVPDNPLYDNRNQILAQSDIQYTRYSNDDEFTNNRTEQLSKKDNEKAINDNKPKPLNLYRFCRILSNSFIGIIDDLLYLKWDENIIENISRILTVEDRMIFIFTLLIFLIIFFILFNRTL